ncbi:FecR domain-containing protein [Bradyrhizobium sp. LHD-71]|uniref:FecR family protein n=1 Tax=Bradyrhizobium sp. LHD-71 TaxID=3072141 RepID=UPI00280E6FE3|nr:FecR domain-containing protein [Bradyrhizobium sp. LHD-71]MDQ8730433.1 FecR domain-containing protein [Bradyrhizobium sp. LHD-71]
MTEEASERDRLFTEATDLMIRLKNDPDNPVPHRMIREWRTRSPDHESTWAEVADIHGMMVKIITDDRAAERRAAATRVTRRALVIAGLVGAGAAASYLAVPRLLVEARADFRTGTGEIRRVDLADGSVATLGPDSAIAVQFTEGQRFIRLLQGMAFFDVATDPNRPFRVGISELVTTALGTAFEVSDGAGYLSVSVDHGTVEVASTKPGIDTTRLSAGQWLAFEERGRTSHHGTRESGQIAAWRSGQLFAEDEPVSSVIAKIGRWQPGRMIVIDPNFGAQRVSGVFDVTDPSRALQALVHPFGGRVRMVGSYLTVISPI